MKEYCVSCKARVKHPAQTQPGWQAGSRTSTRSAPFPGATEGSNTDFHLTETYRNLWFLLSMEAVVTRILHSRHYATACADKLLALKVYNCIN